MATAPGRHRTVGWRIICVVTGLDLPLPVELLVGLLVLAGGYLVGSLPVSARVELATSPASTAPGRRRAARGGPRGAALTADGVAVWRAAGPGPGLLAIAGDVAKGLLPVAIAGVTWTWWAGWVAGLGIVVGSRWPVGGRRPGRGDVVVLAGTCVALSPVAGIVAAGLALVAGAATRALGGRIGFAVLVAGTGCFAVLVLVEQGAVARTAAIAALAAVAALPLPAARR